MDRIANRGALDKLPEGWLYNLRFEYRATPIGPYGAVSVNLWMVHATGSVAFGSLLMDREEYLLWKATFRHSNIHIIIEPPGFPAP